MNSGNENVTSKSSVRTNESYDNVLYRVHPLELDNPYRFEFEFEHE